MIVFDRVIRELEAQLEYERIRREELEADSDKLRSKIHSLTVELEEIRNMTIAKVTKDVVNHSNILEKHISINISIFQAQAPRSPEPVMSRQRKKKTKPRPHTAFASGLHGFFD